MRSTLLALVMLCGGAALAQDAGVLDGGADAGTDDAGALDAGPVDCTPRCEGDVLLFCEGDDDLVELDCAAELDGACGELSSAWGSDCLLPEGAACWPGYADGVGRCEGGASGDVCCVAQTPGEEGVCTARSGSDCLDVTSPAAPLPGLSGVEDTDDDLDGCLGTGCAGLPGLSLLPLFVVLRLRRRRRS